MRKDHEHFEHVDPRCSLSGSNYPDDKPLAPHQLNLSKLGFEDGDYVGISRTGSFVRDEPQKNPAENLVMSYGEKTKQDVDSEPNELMRLEYGLTIKLATGDSYFKDNSDTDGNFGAVISYVNSKPKKYVEVPVASYDEDFSVDDEALNSDGLEEIDLEDVGDGPFGPPIEVTHGNYKFLQYRGWYANDAWSPRSSHWHGRPRGKHNGADLFMPLGTRVLSPIAGYFEPLYGNDFGNHARIKFRRNGHDNWLYLCHLTSFLIEKPQMIGARTPIGTSGCTGNAKNGLPCGSATARNNYGGRSDHLHVEVRTENTTKKSKTVDPVEFFGWTDIIKY